MNFNITLEEENVQALKEEFGIRPSKAHCLNLELWRYSDFSKPQLQCRVSVFTNDDRCVQGNGPNFADALDDLRVALKPKSQNLECDEEVKVLMED